MALEPIAAVKLTRSARSVDTFRSIMTVLLVPTALLTEYIRRSQYLFALRRQRATRRPPLVYQNSHVGDLHRLPRPGNRTAPAHSPVGSHTSEPHHLRHDIWQGAGPPRKSPNPGLSLPGKATGSRGGPGRPGPLPGCDSRSVRPPARAASSRSRRRAPARARAP